jgi:transposase
VGAGGGRLQPSAGEKGGAKTGPSPVDRGRRGSKHHLLVDGAGIPLAWTLTGGNRNDVTQLLKLLDRVPPVRGQIGRPRRRPRTLIADRGYDHDKYRRLVWQWSVK